MQRFKILLPTPICLRMVQVKLQNVRQMKSVTVSGRFEANDSHVCSCSAVKVERLLSETRYIVLTLTHSRTMAPILFEAILFLCANDTLWNLQSSTRAKGTSCSQR